MKSSVVILEDHFEEVKKAVSGNTLLLAARAGGGVIETYAKMNASAGRPGLNVDTGALVNSIVVQDGGNSATHAEVNIGPTVEYGRIHELGGIIKPVAAKMLSWVNDAGERIMANEVHIPARPYLRPAFDEHKDDIRAAIQERVRIEIEGALK